MPTPTPPKKDSKENRMTVDINQDSEGFSEGFMSWFEAEAKVLEGHRVSRASWDTTAYIYMGQDDILHLYRDGRDYTLLVSRFDMEADDWIIYK